MTHTQTIINLLQYEVDGDVKSATSLLSDKYIMTWMYKKEDKIFPQVKIDKNFNNEMEQAYSFGKREYKIYNILEKDNVVMAEIVESYFDHKDNKTYTTPISFVWTFDDQGKVLTGKHYCDPALSYVDISDEDMGRVYGEVQKVVNRTF